MRIVSVPAANPCSPHGSCPPRVYRLPPPKSFAEASALVEAALGELRAAEVALERQLSDLRGYLRTNDLAPAVQSHDTVQ